MLTISALGYEIREVRTIENEKTIRNPLTIADVNIGKIVLESNIVDKLLLSGDLEFALSDIGLVIDTNKRKFKVKFDPAKFRPSDVPILMANIEKIKKLGFSPKMGLIGIINDQINYYLDPDHRRDLIDD